MFSFVPVGSEHGEGEATEGVGAPTDEAGDGAVDWAGGGVCVGLDGAGESSGEPADSS